MSGESAKAIHMILNVSKTMDMESAIVAARTLYLATRDPELKAIMDRAELCWYQWRDDSDYNQLTQVCVNVMSHMF